MRFTYGRGARNAGPRGIEEVKGITLDEADEGQISEEQERKK